MCKSKKYKLSFISTYLLQTDGQLTSLKEKCSNGSAKFKSTVEKIKQKRWRIERMNDEDEKNK